MVYVEGYLFLIPLHFLLTTYPHPPSTPTHILPTPLPFILLQHPNSLHRLLGVNLLSREGNSQEGHRMLWTVVEGMVRKWLVRM